MAKCGLLIGFTLCVILLCVNAANYQIDKDAGFAKNSMKKVADGITNFTIELLYHTASEAEAHLVVSPFSVWAILTIMAEGAGGITYDELKKKLRLDNEKIITRAGFRNLDKSLNHNTVSVEISSTNILFTDVHRPLKQEFEDVITTYYNVTVFPLNFFYPQRAVSEINSYISLASHRKITALLKEDDLMEPQMIVANVIYFKGQWSVPFNRTATKVQPFYNENGVKIGEVNMMYQRAAYPLANIKEFEAMFCELPYGDDNKYSMLIIMPRKKVPLNKLFLHLATEPIKKMFDKLKEAAEELEDVLSDIYLPRFKIDSDLVLNKALNNVGIFEVFDPEYADLGGISYTKTYLARVVHKAVIDVTEEGTVAAAVSGGELLDRTQPALFKVDRPFVYLVVEKQSEIILFGGIYSKPSLY